MGQAEVEVKCTLNAQSGLGESPVWSVAEQALYWVDIGTWPQVDASMPPPSINRFDPATGATRCWPLPEVVGCFALREGNGAILALLSGLYDFDFVTGNLRLLAKTPYNPRDQRFNDGKCDRAGRFWVGQSRRRGAEPPPLGELYCYDGRTLEARGFPHATSNAIAWSPDDKTMYFCDSAHPTLWALDYDIARGQFSGRREFATWPQPVIFDGAAVDAEGGLWVAQFRAGRVVRYLPDGRLDREVAMPVTNPTMVAFGGPALDTLYVTSARQYLSPEELAREPLAGAIFSFRPGVKGLPEPLFRSRG